MDHRTPPPTHRLVDIPRDRQICQAVEVAATPWRRMKGLLGREGLPPDRGLLIAPCNSIHTCFMRFPIDVLFLGRTGTVVRIHRSVKPFRFLHGGMGAKTVLEMAAGHLSEAVQLGDELTLIPLEDEASQDRDEPDRSLSESGERFQ